MSPLLHVCVCTRNLDSNPRRALRVESMRASGSCSETPSSGRRGGRRSCRCRCCAETPDAAVDDLYDFWFRFKSWREHPDESEHDTESAECREHKRWMERQNAALRSKNKKREDKRLMAFTGARFRPAWFDAIGPTLFGAAPATLPSTSLVCV